MLLLVVGSWTHLRFTRWISRMSTRICTFPFNKRTVINSCKLTSLFWFILCFRFASSEITLLLNVNLTTAQNCWSNWTTIVMNHNILKVEVRSWLSWWICSFSFIANDQWRYDDKWRSNGRRHVQCDRDLVYAHGLCEYWCLNLTDLLLKIRNKCRLLLDLANKGRLRKGVVYVCFTQC